MKKLLSILLLGTTLLLQAQSTKEMFIGIQPGITKEQFYEDDEFDINILPIVVQFSLTNRAELRIANLLNYHLGGNNQISDVGLEFTLPVYFKPDEEPGKMSHGFYLAPGSGLGRNFQNNHYTFNIWLEPGYTFKPSKSFTLSIFTQQGATFFNYDNTDNKWRHHMAVVKVNLGWIIK